MKLLFLSVFQSTASDANQYVLHKFVRESSAGDK